MIYKLKLTKNFEKYFQYRIVMGQRNFQFKTIPADLSSLLGIPEDRPDPQCAESIKNLLTPQNFIFSPNYFFKSFVYYPTLMETCYFFKFLHFKFTPYTLMYMKKWYSTRLSSLFAIKKTLFMHTIHLYLCTCLCTFSPSLRVNIFKKQQIYIRSGQYTKDLKK